MLIKFKQLLKDRTSTVFNLCEVKVSVKTVVIPVYKSVLRNWAYIPAHPRGQGVALKKRHVSQDFWVDIVSWIRFPSFWLFDFRQFCIFFQIQRDTIAVVMDIDECFNFYKMGFILLVSEANSVQACTNEGKVSRKPRLEFTKQGQSRTGSKIYTWSKISWHSPFNVQNWWPEPQSSFSGLGRQYC